MLSLQWFCSQIWLELISNFEKATIKGIVHKEVDFHDKILTFYGLQTTMLSLFSFPFTGQKG